MEECRTNEMTKKQNEAFELIKDGKNIFITGPGGTGKSYLLKKCIEWFKQNIETVDEKIYVTSTTGLSAILVDGMTINRFAGIGTGDKSVEDYFKKITKMKHLKKRWLETKILIIDEISMMNPNLFDKLDLLGQKIRKNKKPFGGIQMITSGDFLQLPPVKSDEFCFESFSWSITIDYTIYLNEIVRQNDPTLQNILNNVRIGNITEEVRNLLNSCLNREFNNQDGIKPTLLFSTKSMVEKHNSLELHSLLESGKRHHTYSATYEYSKNINKINYDLYKDLINNHYNVDDTVLLTLQSQVMLIVNMPEFGLANGSCGIIIDFSVLKNNPIVLFENNIQLEIKPHEFTIDENGDLIKKIQIPLILSWAITIHKAQGMSLQYVKTDIGNSIFEYGQAYVVLSRIRNIEGLSLINIDYSKIKAHPKILEYYNSL
jgi:ATP-dependent DNA helicase PIF1